MRVLIVTGNFRAHGVNSWLLDDLACEFRLAGHDVDVIVHSPTTPRPRGVSIQPDGTVTFSVGAQVAPRGGMAKLISYLATGFRLRTSGSRWASRHAYDLCIYTSIAAFSYGLPSALRRRGGVRSLLLVMWDFFPVHQIDIGRVRSRGLGRVMKSVERWAMADADVIATMSPANERFLSSYHPGLLARSIIIPPWAAPAGADSVTQRDRFSVIFGGQLSPGRGVDSLIRAAALLRGEEIDIVIAGSGPDEQALRQLAYRLRASDVEFVGALAREQYRQLLRSCHVGIAITVAGVRPPSFPSKIVEYCANGIPSIVSVEASSDAGEFVVLHGAGLSVAAGDPLALADAVRQLRDEHLAGTLATRSARASALFNSQLSVVRAAEIMIEAAAPSLQDRT